MFTDYVLQVINYNILFVLISLSGCGIYILLDRKKKYKIKIIDIAAIVILVMLAYTRCNVGSDYYNYYIIYNFRCDSLPGIFQMSGFQCFLYIVCCFFKKITENPYGIFLIAALLIYPSLVWVARKETGRASVVICGYMLFGYFGMSLNILKQAVAMQFIVLAFYMYQKNKKISTVLFCILAMMSHISSAFAIFLIAISSKIKPTKNMFYKTCIGILVFKIFYKRIGLYICNNISIFNRYTRYFEKAEVFVKHSTLNTAVYIEIVFYLILIYISLCYMGKLKEISSCHERIVSMLMLGVIVAVPGSDLWIINRVAVYLLQFIIFLFPDLVSLTIHSKGVRMIVLCLSVGYMLVFNTLSHDNMYYRWETIYKATPQQNYNYFR